jgi:hypothetical protein
MDEREKLLVILWRAEEAIRPKRQAFRVMRLKSPSGPLIRHSGLRGEGDDHAFIHHPRPDIEDLIDDRSLRRRRNKTSGGEQWEIDLTEQGRQRAKAILASQTFRPETDELATMKGLIDDRIAAAGEDEAKGRWQALKGALDNLDNDEARALIKAIKG